MNKHFYESSSGVGPTVTEMVESAAEKAAHEGHDTAGVAALLPERKA